MLTFKIQTLNETLEAVIDRPSKHVRVLANLKMLCKADSLQYSLREFGQPTRRPRW